MLMDIPMPGEMEGTKAVLLRWLKQPGDAVAAEEPVAELETDKVALEVCAPSAGVLREIVVTAGSDVTTGMVLGRLWPDAAASVQLAASGPGSGARDHAAPARQRSAMSIADFDPALRLSPSVRRRLMESRVDPSLIEGTGRDGRLTLADVQTHIDRGAEALPANASVAAKATVAGLASRRIPHDAMRTRIAAHMAQSLASAPHVTAVFEADFSAIIAHRNANRAKFELLGTKLTYTAYLVAACVQAMAAAPAVNCRWHDTELELFDDINVGVGTALGDRGLIVPVVHRAQSLSLLGIAARLQETTERARSGKLALSDVQGGTFSISNHGVSGSLLATPIIINQPQSAILGVGAMQKRVVVRELGGVDCIQIRPMAFVSLTIDHRVVDGAQTNAWLTRFVEVLEAWPLA